MKLTDVPADLPVPEDDGAASHLTGAKFPDISFVATNGQSIRINDAEGTVVLYIYPMTGRPDTDLPVGWDSIPGARGCTPQSCSYRDHQAELQAAGASVHGLSSQTTAYQSEARDRLHLPFELLSDAEFQLKQQLGLPTFQVDDMELYKRMTLIVQNGVIGQVFYPVFPTTEDAGNVLAWLTA